MTPQLQQAIKLLALTNVEIEAFIQQEVERNPLLEIADEDGASEGGTTAPASGGDDLAVGQNDDGGASTDFDGNGEPPTSDRLLQQSDVAADTPLDVDYGQETYHHDSQADSPASGANGAPPGGTGEETGIDALSSDILSLHDHLTEQAALAFTSRQGLIAAYLIDLIDESGYLTEDPADISRQLGAATAEVLAVLETIQRFDPIGVGARSLAECLAIQARAADRYDPAMATLIDNLPLLARGELATLRRLCGVDQEDMADMIRELRGYDPKPGLRFGGERPQLVVPDIHVLRRKHGWTVELNTATLPRLLVDRRYHAELARKGSRAERSFLSECLTSANWLVKALDQRARTIVKVASAIVAEQQAFFDHGISHLKPLTLRQLADIVGVHESTISRVTSNKYLSCERGLFELRYFFTSGIQSADGESVSARTIKDRIKTLIEAEQANAILSDDALVEQLRAQGFDIARRTVTKYREAMNIGSSVQRRRQKRLAQTGG